MDAVFCGSQSLVSCFVFLRTIAGGKGDTGGWAALLCVFSFLLDLIPIK